ncbi:MAG: S8 family serine peptidase, partial [Nitrospinales bacterium]
MKTIIHPKAINRVMRFIDFNKLSTTNFSLFALVLFSFVLANGVWAQGPPSINPKAKHSSSRKYSLDRVIVKFKDKYKADLKKLKEGISTNGTGQIKKNLDKARVKILREHRSVGITILRVMDKTMSIEEICKTLEASGMVEYAEPDYEYQLDLTPDDTFFGLQWNLHNTGQSGGTVDADIDAPEAWDIQTGDGSVIVGTIDTGVDYNHVDLAANMWINTGEIASNGIDDDGNGYIDDIHGINSINGVGDPLDDHNHGTHVAGILGAVGNNSLGVAGVNHNVKIIACKFLDSGGSGFTSDAIECLAYFKDMKDNHGWNIQVINASWGGGAFSTALKTAIESAGDSGMLFVASAGNTGANNDSTDHYPSDYTSENIIAVANTDRNDSLQALSNFGATSVDLGAPGSDIPSTLIGNNYGFGTGTSMAAPHVAGAAALVWANKPSLIKEEVKHLILTSVDPIPALSGITVTGGRLNLNKALMSPVLAYSTFLGGTHADEATAIAVDSSRNAYITGFTISLDFPFTSDAHQSIFAGSVDVFVTKLNATGDQIIYSTYLGGEHNDQAKDIAVDEDGNA